MASPRGTEDHFTDKESVRCSTLFGSLRLDIVFEIICRNADHSGNNFTRNSRNTEIFSFFTVHRETATCKNKKIFFMNRRYGSFKPRMFWSLFCFVMS